MDLISETNVLYPKLAPLSVIKILLLPESEIFFITFFISQGAKNCPFLTLIILPVFDKIKKELKLPILTDIHNEEQCSLVSNHVDVLQIPAFLCRQTDLLIAAAKTNKIINVKKGQFLAPWDMVNVTKKISDSGNNNILVTERGASFGYNTLVSDMRSIPIMAKNGYPVIFDATHSVQQPGGMGEKSGGQREFVEHLSRAAIAVGVAGIFIETHQDPDNAPSDGPNMIHLNNLEKLINQLFEIDSLIKK